MFCTTSGTKEGILPFLFSQFTIFEWDPIEVQFSVGEKQYG